MGLFNNDLRVWVKEVLDYVEEHPQDSQCVQLSDVLTILNFLKNKIMLEQHTDDYTLNELLLSKGMRNKTVRLDTSTLDYQLGDSPKNTLFESIEEALKHKAGEAIEALEKKYAQNDISSQQKTEQTALIQAKVTTARHYLEHAKIKAQMSASAIASKVALDKCLLRLMSCVDEKDYRDNGDVIAIRANIQAIRKRLDRHSLCTTKSEEGHLIIEEDSDALFCKNDSLKTREEMKELFGKIERHLKQLNNDKRLLARSPDSKHDTLKYLRAPLYFAQQYFKVKNDINYDNPTKENSELSKNVNRLVDTGIKIGVSGSVCLIIGGLLHLTPLAPLGTVLVVAGAAQSILCGFPAGLYRVGNMTVNGSHGIAPRKDEIVTFAILGASIATLGVARLLPLNGALLRFTNNSTKVCLGTLGAIGVAGVAENIRHQLEGDIIDEDQLIEECFHRHVTLDKPPEDLQIEMTEFANAPAFR